ncbi:MAG TPA: type II secretion system protein GspG [Thermoanaerobaculia bacterium]|nr:type II secretion system protein GspG [Thermoanaerobaculia bacterium]HUM28801.1 type II secretion system protein GspG [Thermoanaerobaculia bacterium]HXK69058.1 type II secretion system protein GspG [Thermoanaerobaculia bacterium]
MKSSRKGGITLIELVVVVTVIAILTMVAVSAVLYGLKEARQKVSMGELQEVARALELYQVDNDGYPPLGVPPVAIAALEPYLVPAYIQSLPEHDPWGHTYIYSRATPMEGAWRVEPGGGKLNTTYFLLCSGMDGAVENDLSTLFPGIPTEEPLDKYDEDIVISQASFIHLP